MTLQKNFQMIDSSTEIVSSFKDKEGNEMLITGKEAYLTEFNVNVPSPMAEDVFNCDGKLTRLFIPEEAITISMEFKLNQFDADGNANYIVESFMDGFKPKRKISKLRVDDCSIEELMFAVREKIK